MAVVQARREALLDSAGLTRALMGIAMLLKLKRQHGLLPDAIDFCAFAWLPLSTLKGIYAGSWGSSGEALVMLVGPKLLVC